ncbi:23S ribosomal RNA methyltransferase Erm [Dactylosporangium sp. CS-033363]|uniref:23S ribosomal RNA methyltransferase Erm n=1 Tax=Dactylosporangium sp. CS-033363 TaxID=3239935 RepID=UPI003D90DA80
MSRVRAAHPRARRVYGQNFLADPVAVRRVVEATNITTSDLVVEVGAGRGRLTEELLRRAGHVIAYEVDPDMARALPRRAGLTVRTADFLGAEPPGGAFAVVGNIPYALTSAVVGWCLAAPGLTSATLLTQLEYARKRTGDYGRWSRLTIETWPGFDWHLAGHVPRAAFRPVPRVDGGILRLTRRPEDLVRSSELRRYQMMVRLGFSGVGGSLLASLATRHPPVRVTAAFRALRLDPRTPVGLVWPEQWLTLFRLLNAKR